MPLNAPRKEVNMDYVLLAKVIALVTALAAAIVCVCMGQVVLASSFVMVASSIVEKL